MRKLFGTDGVRGIAGEFLSHSLARSIGYALGQVLKKGSGGAAVIIGTDTRESCTFLKKALAEGLTLAGGKAYDIGIVSTPAVAYLTKKNGYDAGVMISASHNSYEYNGIKIFASDGFKLSDSEEEEIEELVLRSAIPDEPYEVELIPSYHLKNEYIEYLKGFVRYDLSGLRAVIDCANGSAVSTAREVFDSAGLVAEYIGCSPDGVNINRDCGSTHLSLLRERVLSSGADIGIAFDGDADRFLAIDERGNEVDGDFILAILSIAMREKGRLSGDTVVGTVMSNYGLTKFAEDNSLAFVATKVGDRYVLEEMVKSGYALGGEQSGHVIIREAATTGDGQLTAIYLLNRLAETKKPLSELASVMKKYPQHLVNVSADEEGKRAFGDDPLIKSVIRDAESRLAESGRILVRPSGTEPVVRIMTESSELDTAVSVCESVAEKIRAILASKQAF